MCNACTLAAIKASSVPYNSDANPWLRIASDTDSRMRALFNRLVDREITVEVWQRLYVDILIGAHSDSHMIGQGLAATFEPRLGLARLRAGDVMSGELGYVLGFANDLRSGRYDGEDGVIDVDRVMNRARLYIGKTRGTSGMGFVDGSPVELEFNWRLGGVEEHCEDCPIIAGLSPFTLATIYTHPGAGDTPCLGNCQCYWEREDGLISARVA